MQVYRQKFKFVRAYVEDNNVNCVLLDYHCNFHFFLSLFPSFFPSFYFISKHLCAGKYFNVILNVQDENLLLIPIVINNVDT